MSAARQRMRHFGAATLALLLAFPWSPGCSPSPRREIDGEAGRASEAPLLVFAASDLLLAFEELGPLHRAHTGVDVDLVLGSTGRLAAQIKSGAPADLFFAADEAFLDELVAAGRIDPKSRSLYAVGRLVLVAPPGALPPSELAALAGEGYRLVAIANPEHAPYGIAAREALESAGIWNELGPRLVLGENVAHTYQFARTGNVDAAIVALGLVRGAPGPEVPCKLVDQRLHAPLLQAAGIATDSRRPAEARAFLDLVLSEEGRAILERHGFERPPGG